MIEHRDDIIALLDDYIVMQQEYTYQFLRSDVEPWSGERLIRYGKSIAFGKFIEGDVLTMQALEEGVSDAALQEEIRLYLKREIKAINDTENPDPMQRGMLPRLQNQYQQLSLQPIDDWINNFEWIVHEVTGIPHSQVRVLIYLHYAFINFDSIRKNPYNSDLSSLATEYGRIFNKQSQFKSYGLVPIDQYRSLLPINPPRIYDCSINKTFFTKNIPLHLLEKLADMKSKGILNDLAVRLMNEPGHKGRMYSEYLQEALERGEYFDLANLGRHSVSRLYSDQYDDCLWVVIDSGNITFEELCDNYEIAQDMIVTQVVHLEYMTSNEGEFITHLDHEYIFYTLDEYENRVHNPAQKGEAKTRMKSFKVDNSRIPFDYTLENKSKDENGNDLPVQKVPFLYYVLESYFKHKDLLLEYFQRIQ